MAKRQLRIMAVGAHPDDCELTTGGTCLLYAAAGHAVKYVYATSGDAGHHKLDQAELAKVRAEEARRACAVGGFDHEFMDNRDGYLEASIKNRDALIRIIRAFRPDIIFTHRTNDYHSDHRCAALIVQDTAYLLMVPKICPDVPALDYAPVIMQVADSFRKPLPFQADIAVAIDPVMEQKVRMLDCHRSQFYEWLPWISREADAVPADPQARLAWLSRKAAERDAALADRVRPLLDQRYGRDASQRIQYAEAFELSEYGGHPTEQELQAYFPF